MFNALFHFFSELDSFFWSYVAFVLIALLGGYLTYMSRFFQIRHFPKIWATFFSCLATRSSAERGVHPLKAFFASVGGMIGIGNVVGIVTSVQIGGPGALLWVWIAMLFGTIIKYAEIYLGLKYRIPNGRQGYDGGPIYFLQRAFGTPMVAQFVALLLCIYGVEIYQFKVISESVSTNWQIDSWIAIGVLLGVVFYASVGGILRIGKFCSFIMPVFLVAYIAMGIWVIFQERAILGSIFSIVFQSAFTGHAAVGGFAGSSMLLAIQHGISRAAYSADIGIGYDSIIQSESSAVDPERQASLAVLGVVLDNIICTMSILIVLVTGVWKSTIEGSHLVQTALSGYFSFMPLFMPIFFLVLGLTTVTAYFAVGIKCARFLHPKYGVPIYLAYAALAWPLFSFLDQSVALLVMSLSGALLLITNLLGIFRLRKLIGFNLRVCPVLN